MRGRALLAALTASLGVGAGTAQAHAPWKHDEPLATPLIHYIAWLRSETREARAARCLPRLRVQYVPAGTVPRGLRPYVVLRWRERLHRARAARSACVPWYVRAQVRAGNVLGRESSGDPWPNCPDPWDGSRSSWSATVGCENGGSWLDSPGFYRCGLQFHPMWERRFGRLCP